MKECTRHAVQSVVRECWQNRGRLLSLAVYDIKVRNSGTWFGFLWNFFNPALQILVYWFVFAIGLKSAAPQGEYSYLIWMIMGIIPWFYISEALNASTLAIYGFQAELKRMRFPVAIVPIKTVLASLISHVMAMVVVMGIFFASGYRIGIHFLSVFYYMAASFVFLAGYALLASAITVLFKDFQKIISSVIRLLFYISPVVWVQDSLSGSIAKALRLNPLAYLINGYRDSILYNQPFYAEWRYGLYFWAITLLLLWAGCTLHMRFRKRFMDVI